MSNHANKASGTPTSSRQNIKGANPTYKTSMQKQSRNQPSSKIAGSGKIKELDHGEGSIPKNTEAAKNVGGYGSGHYTPKQ